MRKKYSLGLIIFIFIAILAVVLIYRISYYTALRDMEEDLLEELTDLDDYYFIKENNGYVTVYYADEETVYEYTSIPVEELPIGIQNELKKGKRVNTVRQIYGFLENYSSWLVDEWWDIV